MFSAVKLQTPIPTISHSNFIKADGTLNSSPVILRFPPRRFNVRSHQSSRNVSSAEPSVSSEISSFIGSPSLPPPQLNLSQRHITVLNILACAVIIFLELLLLICIFLNCLKILSSIQFEIPILLYYLCLELVATIHR